MQCFVKKNFTSTFQNEKTPKLLYVCKADADLTKLPCVMHMHEDRLEILYIRHGRGIHTIRGKQYHTKKGDILIYNSGTLHDERTNPDAEMSVYSCAVSNLKLEGLRENCLLPDDANPVLKSGTSSEDVENIFKIMHSQIYSQNNASEEISNYLLWSLISIILNQLGKSAVQHKTTEYFIGNHIKKYIDDHYFKDLTLDILGNELNISPSYLCSIFKKNTGYTFNQYITNLRIGKAQSLLINTDYNVTDIAFMVGYHDSNYFSTIFTKTVGISPLKYRKLWVISSK